MRRTSKASPRICPSFVGSSAIRRSEAGAVSTAFLLEHAPLSTTPLRTAPGVFAQPWRLNLPSPSPSAAPDVDATDAFAGAPGGQSVVAAPMPGNVISVAVEVGDIVSARQPLVVLEAMKMEMPILAPFSATVTAVRVTPGDQVAAGTPLIELG